MTEWAGVPMERWGWRDPGLAPQHAIWPIPRGQARCATDLINDAETHAALIELIPLIPRYVLDMIAAAHQADRNGCAANDEGMSCCIDILTDDPNRFTPDKVQAARELRDRYLRQLKEQGLA